MNISSKLTAVSVNAVCAVMDRLTWKEAHVVVDLKERVFQSPTQLLVEKLLGRMWDFTPLTFINRPVVSFSTCGPHGCCDTGGSSPKQFFRLHFLLSSAEKLTTPSFCKWTCEDLVVVSGCHL